MKKEKLIAFTAILLFILVINISAEENNTDPFELCFSDWVQTDGTYQYGTLAWGSSEEEVEKYLDVTLEQPEDLPQIEGSEIYKADKAYSWKDYQAQLECDFYEEDGLYNMQLNFETLPLEEGTALWKQLNESFEELLGEPTYVTEDVQITDDSMMNQRTWFQERDDWRNMIMLGHIINGNTSQLAAAVVRMKPVENREKEIDVSSFVQTEDFTYQGLPWNLSKEEAEEFLGETLDFESEDKELGRVIYRAAEKVTYGTEEGTVFLEFADDASGLSGLDTVRIEFTGENLNDFKDVVLDQFRENLGIEYRLLSYPSATLDGGLYTWFWTRENEESQTESLLQIWANVKKTEVCDKVSMVVNTQPCEKYITSVIY